MLLFALKMLYYLLGDPHNDANAVGTDAFKTLFIGRIVCIHHCLLNADAAKESGLIQYYYWLIWSTLSVFAVTV